MAILGGEPCCDSLSIVGSDERSSCTTCTVGDVMRSSPQSSWCHGEALLDQAAFELREAGEDVEDDARLSTGN